MDLKELERLIAVQAVASADSPLRGRDDVGVRAVLNYGGFVNRSFRIAAGDDAYHVKVANEAVSRRGLERWRALATRLSTDFRAPRMRGWIEIPGTSCAGPVFDWIEGTRPPGVAGPVRRHAVDALERLHGDRRMAAALEGMGDVAVSCAEAYRASYHQRFTEDLALIGEQPPPFVSAELVEWMRAEAGSLARVVEGSAAFAEPAAVATHRDLWLDNLLLTVASALYILDWDGIGLGDAMMDWAMLLGPARSAVRPAAEQDLPNLPFTTAERERFRLYARASLLDWTIDPLADWVEAADEPEHGEAVRSSNRLVHVAALTRYRAQFGRR